MLNVLTLSTADILGKLGQGGVEEVARSTGTDPRQTEAATGAAISARLKRLADNSNDQKAAEELIKALRRDHGKFAPSQMQVEVAKANPKDTSAILRHIFGEKQEKVERQLGNATGVGQGNMGKILASLAPVVLGMLANRSKQSKVDTGPDLLKWLGQQTQQMQKEAKNLGFLDSLLDQDSDGDVDIGDMAGRIGKFLGGSR